MNLVGHHVPNVSLRTDCLIPCQVKLETVVRITGKSTHDLPAGNATEATSADGAAAGGAGGNSTAVDSSDAAAEAATDVDRIIDSQDNEFVLSKPK